MWLRNGGTLLPRGLSEKWVPAVDVGRRAGRWADRVVFNWGGVSLVLVPNAGPLRLRLANWSLWQRAAAFCPRPPLSAFLCVCARGRAEALWRRDLRPRPPVSFNLKGPLPLLTRPCSHSPTSSLSSHQLISPFSVYFNARLIFRKAQLWRLFTNFFFFGNIGARKSERTRSEREAQRSAKGVLGLLPVSSS